MSQVQKAWKRISSCRARDEQGTQVPEPLRAAGNGLITRTWALQPSYIRIGFSKFYKNSTLVCGVMGLSWIGQDLKTGFLGFFG